MSNKLYLCSGPDKPEGWTTLDANPDCAPHICQAVPPLPPEVRDTRWDVIQLIHGIEHFYLWEARRLLKECYEVLSLGGLLILEQPNILFAARVLSGLEAPLTSVEGQSDMWPLYGDPNHQSTLFCHRWGWTPESLKRELEAVGFKHIIEVPAMTHLRKRDFRLEANKC